ncbi:hypothetical protein FDECE_10379 [Fusarium decemcellulare]|nr:hypothetical protein FDECE_10379 [Fusarium decemcellulare]
MSIPQTTKQWVVKRPEGISGLEMQEVPIPKLGQTDVLIKVHAVSLNYHDMGVVDGHWPSIPKDLVAASDGAGVVVAVGSNVNGVQPGDKVTTVMNGAFKSGQIKLEFVDLLIGTQLHGVLSEYAVVPEGYLMPLPRNLSFIEGSTLPVAGLTAWNALHGTPGRPLLPGQWILTQGSGGVSTFVILFAKVAGAKVIATTSSPEKAEKLKKMGADYVINYKEVEEWGQQVRDLTPGKEGVDLVVEIGGGVTLAQSFVAVKADGLISVVGIRGGPAEKAPALVDMFFRFCTLRIAYVGPRSQFEDMNRSIEANNIKPIVDGRIFSFEEAKEAYKYMEEMKQIGKICIKVSEEA